MMKFHLFILIAISLAASATEYHETEDEFEKEFNVLVNDPDMEAEEAEKLAEVEDQINEQNEKFEKGEATFDEKLYPESNLPDEEFAKEKEGMIMPSTSSTRSMGLIMPSMEERNDPINAEKFESVYRQISRESLPSSYNAVSEKLVTPPKNQKQCGSCSAFAATSLHETCMLKAGAPFDGLDLSEQHLVDCGYDTENGMNGCNGASPHAYQAFYKKSGGQGPHEAQYQYTNTNPTLKCPSDLKIWNSGAKVDYSLYTYACDETTLQTLVAEFGAVVAGVRANETAFQNYNSGIISGCLNKETNHAVTIVGYGTENGIDYWLGKNSWGTSWGEEGYFRIKRGVNECGIGEVCVVSKCISTQTSDPVPEFPPEPEVPASLQCDISKLFGHPGITGNYNLRVTVNGVEYYSEVSCENSMCTPRSPGQNNACVYICGMEKC